MSISLLDYTLLALLLLASTAWSASSSDFQQLGGSFLSGGLFKGNAKAGSRFSGSSTYHDNNPNQDMGDPFGFNSGRGGSGGMSSGSGGGPTGFSSGGGFGGFPSSSGGSSSDDDSTMFGGSSRTNGATTRSRSASAFASNSNVNSNRQTGNTGSFGSGNGGTSRTGSSQTDFDGTNTDVGGHNLRPSSAAQDRPECTDCRIVTMRPTTTTTSKSWLGSIFGRRR